LGTPARGNGNGAPPGKEQSAKPPFSATGGQEQHKPEPPTAAQDERHLSSGGSFTTGNDEPRADSQESDQATRPAPGQTVEQQQLKKNVRERPNTNASRNRSCGAANGTLAGCTPLRVSVLFLLPWEAV